MNATQPPADPVATAAWARPVRSRWAALCALLIVCGALLVAGAVLGWLARDGLAAFVGGFLALYGAIVVVQRQPPSRIGHALQRRLRMTLASSGVGFYGVMTLARFLQLELHDIIGSIGSFELTRGLLQSLLQDWLIGFSIQSLKNSIDAFLWPVRLMNQHGMPVAGLVTAATWSIYALGSRIFPEVHAVIETEHDDDVDAGAFDRDADADDDDGIDPPSMRR